MASSSAAINPLAGHHVSEKLSKLNHALWKAQVRAAVHGARLQGHVTGDSEAPELELVTKVDDKEVEKPNPAYEEWEAMDQQVLSYLLSSLSKEVMAQVTMCRTAAAAWAEIERMFASRLVQELSICASRSPPPRRAIQVPPSTSP